VSKSGGAALVTGASTGIGKAIAFKLAERGYDLALTHLNEMEEADAVAQKIRKEFGRRCLVIKGDLSESDTAERFWKEAADTYGPIHVLVNNAAVFRFGEILEMKREDILQVLKVNFLSPILLIRQAASGMIAQEISGTIINITSTRAQRAYPKDTIYGSMKAAMTRATEAMALEFGPYGIRINCVAPGVIDSRGTKPEFYRKLGSKIPLGREGKPEDVARAVAWLCSEEASYITGTTIRVDGGLILPGMPEDVSPEAGYGWGKIPKRGENL
jgi:glucose 1-dehydrogenase